MQSELARWKYTSFANFSGLNLDPSKKSWNVATHQTKFSFKVTFFRVQTDYSFLSKSTIMSFNGKIHFALTSFWRVWNTIKNIFDKQNWASISGRDLKIKISDSPYRQVRHVCVVHYCTYLANDEIPRYGKTLSHYIPKTWRYCAPRWRLASLT